MIYIEFLSDFKNVDFGSASHIPVEPLQWAKKHLPNRSCEKDGASVCLFHYSSLHQTPVGISLDAILTVSPILVLRC